MRSIPPASHFTRPQAHNLRFDRQYLPVGAHRVILHLDFETTTNDSPTVQISIGPCVFPASIPEHFETAVQMTRQELEAEIRSELDAFPSTPAS